MPMTANGSLGATMAQAAASDVAGEGRDGGDGHRQRSRPEQVARRDRAGTRPRFHRMRPPRRRRDRAGRVRPGRRGRPARRGARGAPRCARRADGSRPRPRQYASAVAASSRRAAFGGLLELLDRRAHERRRRRPLDQRVDWRAASAIASVADRATDSLDAVARLRIALCQLDASRRSRRQRRAHRRRATSRPRRPAATSPPSPSWRSPGYPPEDLVLKPGFVADNRAALDKVAARTGRVRRRRRLRRRRPRSASTRPRSAPTARCVGIYHKRHPAELRGVRRAALLRARHRAAVALRDRRRAGRRDDLRGRLESRPGRSPSRRRRRRAGRQHQRVALLRRTGRRARAHAGHPGRRRVVCASSTSTRSAARTSWCSTVRRWCSTTTAISSRGPDSSPRR